MQHFDYVGEHTPAIGNLAINHSVYINAFVREGRIRAHTLQFRAEDLYTAIMAVFGNADKRKWCGQGHEEIYFDVSDLTITQLASKLGELVEYYEQQKVIKKLTY